MKNTKIAILAALAATGVLFGTTACSSNEDKEPQVEINDVTTGELQENDLLAQLPASISDYLTANNRDFGELKELIKQDNGTLAIFQKGMVTESDNVEPAPLIGKIGETWNTGGGLDNPVGLPVGPETGDSTTGWTQNFTNGVITWAPDPEAAEGYSATVTVNE